MTNNVLISNDVEKVLEELLPTCNEEINLITGFCKIQTLTYVDSLIQRSVKKRLLVRFLPSDIASGATDKDIYNYCKENGWKIYIDHTIHAKTYVFDHIKCIIGSANLTNKGLGIADVSNKEASVCFELDKNSYTKVLSLYKDSIELNDELYEFIISHTDDTEVIHHRQYKAKKYNIECLFPEDFPNEKSDIIELYQSRSYKWLINYLAKKESLSAFFGELSSSIHDVFVKDPRPYRKQIKQHLSDLLKAIERLKIEEVEITTPNHSQLIRLSV